jgi:hypothetical protein
VLVARAVCRTALRPCVPRLCSSATGGPRVSGPTECPLCLTTITPAVVSRCTPDPLSHKYPLTLTHSRTHPPTVYMHAAGVMGLWRGNFTNCVRVYPHAATQFTVRRGRLLSGAVAVACALLLDSATLLPFCLVSRRCP